MPCLCYGLYLEALLASHIEVQMSDFVLLLAIVFHIQNAQLTVLTCRFLLQWEEANVAACDLAREVAGKGDALVAGGVCQSSVYKDHKDEARIKKLFRLQLKVFTRKNVDFLIAEVSPASASVRVLAGLMCLCPVCAWSAASSSASRASQYSPICRLDSCEAKG